MTQKTKQIIIAVVVIVVAFFGFKMFFVSPEAGDDALVAEKASVAENLEGQLILNLLNKLDRVTLDESIFSNKVFVSLQSFERVLEGQVAGRKNPFMPIGIEESGAAAPKSTSTSSIR